MLSLENSFVVLDLIFEEVIVKKRKEVKSKANLEFEKFVVKFDDDLLSDDEDIFDIEFVMFKRDYYM